MKQAHTVTLVTSQEDTPLKDFKDETANDSKRKTNINMNSPQMVFELAEKLEVVNDDVHVPDFLKVEKNVTDADSVSHISQSMASEQLDTSFATNDD